MVAGVAAFSPFVFVYPCVLRYSLVIFCFWKMIPYQAKKLYAHPGARVLKYAPPIHSIPL